jgi:predicted nucleic acid-binding protein
VQVVLDTNTFYSDLRMRGPIRVLLDRAAAGELTLVIPEVVIQEVLKRFRQRYEKTVQQATSAIRSAKDLGVDTLDLDLESVDQAVIVYEAELRTRLHQDGVLISQYPAASHEDVLDRAIRRRKPFKESGAGYQDTLIWLTVLDSLKRDDQALSF